MARLQLKIRRNWRVKNADRYRDGLLNEPLPAIEISPSPPQPVFPPRCELANFEEGRYTLTFLNEPRKFAHPFDWHPPDLEYGTRLWLLNLHYMEFLEALSDEAFVNVVQDWIANVPPYRQGYWMDDWNSYALSIRCVVWMQQYAKRKDQLPNEFCNTMHNSLYRQVRFLSQNLELDIGGNHLMKNIKALMWAGEFFVSDEALGWYRLGETLLKKELEEQILSDGMHYERSPAYHAQVFADLLECYTLMDGSQLKEVLYIKLEKMAQVLIDLTHPDGYVSLFNDGGLQMTYSTVDCINLWKTITGTCIQARPTFAFEDAGYFGSRSQDEYIVIDCGKVAPDFLTAHAHGDILSFEWTVKGKRMIIDAGVFEYNAGARRAYSRSTSAHNTVTLDGQDQCEFWSAFRMGRRAQVELKNYSFEESALSLNGIHDGYSHLKGAPKHERTFSIGHRKILVEDVVHNGEGQLAEGRLLLHPDCEVSQEGDWIIKRQDVCIRLTTRSEVQVVESAWFPDFGVEQPCKQLVIRYGKSPCKGVFTLERLPYTQ